MKSVAPRKQAHATCCCLSEWALGDGGEQRELGNFHECKMSNICKGLTHVLKIRQKVAPGSEWTHLHREEKLEWEETPSTDTKSSLWFIFINIHICIV